SDGDSGLLLFRKLRPQLVITDVYLPKYSGPDGVEITREIKQNPETQHIPVIAMTAIVNIEVQQQLAEAGCDVFLPKPYTAQQLTEVVCDLLGLPISVNPSH